MGDVLTDFLSLLAQPTSRYFTLPMWQDFLIQKEGKRGVRKKKHLVPETARAGHCARSFVCPCALLLRGSTQPLQNSLEGRGQPRTLTLLPQGTGLRGPAQAAWRRGGSRANQASPQLVVKTTPAGRSPRSKALC